MKIGATIRGGICAFAAFLAIPVLSQESNRLEQDERTWLNAHNQERELFGSAPLRWNEQLAQDAGAWAALLARENTLRHSPIEHRGDAGENLWMGTAGDFGTDEMIANFASEKRYFLPGTFPRVSSTGNWADVGHYTQIVWAHTREVGCASVRGSRYDVLVCRYWPAGNVIGTRIAPIGPLVRR